jgi:RNA polymerase sigma factor (sigma-70 family)
VVAEVSTAAEYGTQVADVAAEAFSAWRDGDERSLDRLVRQLTPLLWHLARSYRLDPAAAEDAVQATWLALVRSGDQVRDPQAVLRWLTVTVQREAARSARGARRTAPTENLGDLDDPGRAEPGADEPVLRVAATSVLWRHVASLSERCRRLLRVIAFADRPDYEALSRELAMPVGSIGPTRGRCLARLRDMLGADPDWSLT